MEVPIGKCVFHDVTCLFCSRTFSIVKKTCMSLYVLLLLLRIGRLKQQSGASLHIKAVCYHVLFIQAN